MIFFPRMREKKKHHKNRDIQGTVSTNEHGFCSATFQPFWFTMHMNSLNYPLNPTKEQKALFSTWFVSSLKVMPCDICVKNALNLLTTLEFDPHSDLESRETFAKFVYLFHEEVNKQLGKQTSVISFQEVNDYYEELRASDCSSDSCTRPTSMPKCIIKIEKQK